MSALHRHSGARVALFLSALALAPSVAHAQQAAGSVGGGKITISVAGTARSVTNLNLSTGLTAVQDGGILTVTTADGGAGITSLDAGAITTALLADASVTSAKIADNAIGLGHFSAALQASIPFFNDAGAIAGYIPGTSAYTTIGYADGGLSDGSLNVTARSRVAFSPTTFYVEDDSDAAATVVRAIPSFGSDIRMGTVSTTNATATKCVDFELPNGSSAIVNLYLVANQFDGGGVNTGTFARNGSFERTDGAVPTLMGGAFQSLTATDRRDDTNWTGAGAPTFDGGVVEINVSGAAGQNISWTCYLQVFLHPYVVRPR